MNTTIGQVTTNEELRTIVLREIESRPDIRSHDINVKVLGNTVMLTGFVHTFAEKGSAESAAKSICGVVSIANDIEVCPGTRTDPEIARYVQHVLKSHAILGDMKISATVQDGFVTLEGIVEWNYQKTSALDATESFPGVRGVINLISVRPPVTAVAVKNDIEAALRRNAELDARNIEVSVLGSTVELRGKVRSFAEREDAELAAWAVPGIESVVNGIQITH